MLAMVGLCPRPLQGASSRTRSKLSGGNGGPEAGTIMKHTQSQTGGQAVQRRTLCLLCEVTAQSLNAIEAVSFNTLQLQGFCILTNAGDLVPDSVQGHHLPLCRRSTLTRKFTP